MSWKPGSTQLKVKEKGHLSSPKRAEQWRMSIRVGLIRNRLMKCILGEIEMSPVQLQACKILLERTLPALATVEVNADVTHNYIARIPQPAQTTEEWAKQNSPELPAQTLQ